jgi:two-component system NtrC family sensor kinase
MTAPTAALSSTPLAVLGDVAARLAAGGEIVAKVTDVLERLRSAFEVDECGLWLYGSEGLVCSALAGSSHTAVADVTAHLDSAGDDSRIVVRRLTFGAERLGALAVCGRALEAPQRDIVTIVANLLAPELANTEQQHRLREEVERRTRQVEDERRFTDQIIDSLPVGLYVIDREYRVCAWNRNRETGYQGVARDHAIGKSIFEVLHRQPASTLRKEFDEVFRSARIQQFNMESQASGALRTYRITKIPMRLNDGPVTHVISIGEDITDWTNAQERFAQSEKLAAIGQLAAGVMHEINNPLATIAACTESLSLRLNDLRAAGCIVPPQAQEFTRIIENEVHRCKGIIDSLLDFSRPKPVKKEPTDLNAVIGQTIFLVKHHTRFKRIQVHTLLDADIERTPANAEQLVQVMMALLINAADAMNGQGNLTIRTRRGISKGEAVVAEVIDEGQGIPRNELPKIFEPFYTTKPPGRGTGLGLSICYAIIEDHHGRIEVDSALGAGSTFRILLPGVVTGDS